MKEQTCFAVYQSEKKRINKTKKHLSLSTLAGYEVASLFNLSLTPTIAPLSNSGASLLFGSFLPGRKKIEGKP